MKKFTIRLESLIFVVVLTCLLQACGGSGSVADRCVPNLVSLETILADLQGLEIEEFFEQSYFQILLRSPETITAYGLSESLGIRDDKLDDISDAFRSQTYDLKAGILELLNSYDRGELTQEQQVSYYVYQWILEDSVSEREFRYHDFPVTNWGSSPQNDLIMFLEDIHPVTNRQEAQDFVTRLEQIQNKLACLRENIALSQEAGVVPLRFMLELAADGIRGIRPGTARTLSFYTTFEEKLQQAQELSSQEKVELLEDAENTLEESVIPAYQALLEDLDELVPNAPLDGGVLRLPDGDSYYAYLLKHHTTTTLSSNQIHQLGLQEVDRIRAEMDTVFDQLGYPADESMSELFGRVVLDGGIIPQNQVISTYEQIIAQARDNLDQAFDIFPAYDVVVMEHPYGGFYVSGSLDGSRPGAFYAYAGSDLPWYDMPSLAYHEAIPGHHLQISIALSLDLPFFRKTGGMFTAFVEGWALYAERLVMELGWYDDDVFADLGRMQMELFRAVRLVVDTGLHAQGWSFQQAVDYMMDKLGFSESSATGQVARYLVMPGQATAYKIGMLKMLELRELAMDELGDEFDLTEFHRVVLLCSRVPLAVLEQIIMEYISDKKMSFIRKQPLAVSSYHWC